MARSTWLYRRAFYNARQLRPEPLHLGLYQAVRQKPHLLPAPLNILQSMYGKASSRVTLNLETSDQFVYRK